MADDSAKAHDNKELGASCDGPAGNAGVRKGGTCFPLFPKVQRAKQDVRSIDGRLDHAFQAVVARHPRWDTKWKTIGIIFLASRILEAGVAITPLFPNDAFMTLVETRLLPTVERRHRLQWIPRLQVSPSTARVCGCRGHRGSFRYGKPSF